MTIHNFQRKILAWYRHNRRDLSWRPQIHWRNDLPVSARKLPPYLTPYHILVSEIMLQQTQIPRVLQKYPLFLKAFPDWETLAHASTRDLFSAWQGMGYWRRALYLRECARQVQKLSALPQAPGALRALPGIGPYTAGAVACFAFQHSDAFIDTNIRRVFIKFFFSHPTLGLPDLPRMYLGRSGSPRKIRAIADSDILPIAQKAVWLPNPREWHYALMDYGALVLGKEHALNKQSAHYYKQSRFEGSPRFWKSHIVHLLLAHGILSSKVLATHIARIANIKKYPLPVVSDLLEDLQKKNISSKRTDVQNFL